MTITVFSADDGNGNVELWASDGTTGRTTRLMDIKPGSGGSFPSNSGAFGLAPPHFAVFGGKAYFAADDGVHGTELWRTDGTTAGTVAITDWAGSSGGVPNGYSPSNILVANSLLFFTGNGPSGFGLYTSTGVPGSTPTFVGTPVGGTTGMIASGSYVYWMADTGLSSSGLYASNGGAPVKITNDRNTTGLVDVGGTAYLIATGFSSNALTRVVGTTPTAVTGAPGSISNYLNVGGTLFFTANTTLYSTNPGITTTTTVKTGMDFSTNGTSMAALGTKLIFTNYTAANGSEVWASDGTAGGTAILKDVIPGNPSIGFVNNLKAQSLTTVGSNVFFQEGDGKGGVDLWKTDGTAGGTVLVRHIQDANLGSSGIQQAHDLQNMSAQGNLLFFTASDGVHGDELWRSDGTAAGTFQVKDINTGGQSNGSIDTSIPTNPAQIGTNTFFMGTDVNRGNELWVTDGTLLGTKVVADIAPGFVNSNPGNLTVLGTNLFFTANDPAHGVELWMLDTASAAPPQLFDLNHGTGSSNPAGLTAVFGNKIIFGADDGVHGYELGITDGTDAGTILLADINPGSSGGVPRSSSPYGYTQVGSNVFFQATSNGTGTELWVTDGTPGGTHITKDINSGNADSNININPNPNSGGYSAVLGSKLYFTADDGSHGSEVWMSDGTNLGTVILKDVNTGAATGSNAHALTVVNGKLLFIADNGGSNGMNLWSSDGTAGNASMLTNIQWNFSLQTLTAAGNKVYFSASTAATGQELFVTNGTAAPTPIDIVNGNTGSNPSNLTAFGNSIYFTADGAAGNGTELWISDGTAGAGTHMVKDLYAGSSSSNPGNLVVVGSLLYFTATDATHGQELWVSDGTSGAGTHMVLDINPGTTNGGIFNIRAVGNHVLFQASDGVHGTEDWISDGTALGTVMLTDALQPNNGTPANFTAVTGTLGAGPETLTGTPDNDYLDGLGGGDTLSGLGGNDTLIGGAGDDLVQGGAGIDTAVFSGNLSDYTITPNFGLNVFSVVDTRGGSPDGTDTVGFDVEVFKFANATMFIDGPGVAPWVTLTRIFDNTGSIAQTEIVGDNGGKWVNFVDTMNNTSVQWSSAHYGSNGHILSNTFTNDDGTHALVLYDDANQFGWADATISFDANWGVTGVVGNQDVGVAPVTLAQLASALDTLNWFTTPYDADFVATAQIYGERPVDNVLIGGGNIDVLFGYGGDDVLRGAGGDDKLIGGTGDDTMFGGAGDDTFVFRFGDGDDTIGDFTAGVGSNDLINLHGYGVANFAALQGLMTQLGTDTLITFDNENHILLQNMTVAQLTAGDFALS